MSTIFSRQTKGQGLKYHTKIVASDGGLRVTIKKIDMSDEVFDVSDFVLGPDAVKAIVEHFAGKAGAQ